MNAMGHTIAGAASGETAWLAAPKGSQSQAKGQKSNKYVFVNKTHNNITPFFLRMFEFQDYNIRLLVGFHSSMFPNH